MSKPKIVAVDDTPFICSTLTAWLQGAYEIKTFSSGKEAITYLSDNDADLILLDYDMPGMTGYEVLMNIRANVKISKVPVIFLTGVQNERMEDEMLSRGASGYIRKPLDITVLREHIAKHLELNK